LLASNDRMHWDAANYKHQALTEKIIHAFYVVYNDLGYGYLESLYEEALFRVLGRASMAVQRQYPLAVWFQGEKIGEFRADFVVADTVIVELKAVRVIEPFHEAQILNYLRASNLEIGLLLNFGPAPKIKRFVFSNEKKLGRCSA